MKLSESAIQSQCITIRAIVITRTILCVTDNPTAIKEGLELRIKLYYCITSQKWGKHKESLLGSRKVLLVWWRNKCVHNTNKCKLGPNDRRIHKKKKRLKCIICKIMKENNHTKVWPQILIIMLQGRRSMGRREREKKYWDQSNKQQKGTLIHVDTSLKHNPSIHQCT